MLSHTFKTHYALFCSLITRKGIKEIPYSQTFEYEILQKGDKKVNKRHNGRPTPNLPRRGGTPSGT